MLVNERCRILFIGFPNQQLQAALNNHFNAKDEEDKPKVLIDGVDASLLKNDEPVLQPGSRPSNADTPGNDAPPLRDMPEF